MSPGLYSGVSGLALGTGLYRDVSGLWSGASGLIAGFDGGNPYSGASLYLDFLTMTAPTFDSRITFSRGSNATLTDSTGKITYAPANLVTYSEDVSSWTDKSSVTVYSNVADAPNGTATADKVSPNASGSGFYAQNNVSIPVAGTYMASVYLKAAEISSNVQLFLGTGALWPGGTNPTVRVNLALGTITFTNNVSNSSITSVGGGWYRVAFSQTATTTGTTGVRVSPTNGVAGDGTSGVYVWGAQLEPVTYQTTPSTYQATTSSAYYGPRFDYDPVSLSAKGLLIEEQRTNRTLYSEDFTGASWVAAVTGTSTRVNDGAPLGFTRGLITATSAGGGIRQVHSGLSSGQVYALSFYIQSTSTSVMVVFENSASAFGAAHSVTINPSNGTAGSLTGFTSVSIAAFGPGYIYTLITAPAGGTLNANIEWRIINNGDSIWLGRPQFEAGSFATSYIPTVASTVSRSADVATMTGSNFSAWYNQAQGTFVVAYMPLTVPASGSRVFSVNDGTSANRMLSSPSQTSHFLVSAASVAQVDLDCGTPSANAVNKLAAGYATNDFAATLNGNAAVTDTSGTVPTVSALNIGSENGSNILNGHVRTLSYYNVRLPNGTLVQLTS